jgi:hypothetical protein
MALRRLRLWEAVVGRPTRWPVWLPKKCWSETLTSAQGGSLHSAMETPMDETLSYFEIDGTSHELTSVARAVVW